MESGQNGEKTQRGPNRPGIKRRQAILNSAEELLQGSSFLEISYADIAARAGLPVSSCYHYYRDKFEVFQALDRNLSEKFASHFDFESNQWLGMDSWLHAIDIYTQKCREFTSQHPLAGELWFKGKLPAEISPTASRDFGIAQRFESMLNRQFELPDIPNRSGIFYCAWEIFEHVMASIWLTNLERDWIFEEANKATKAYLGHYLPLALPRRG